MTSPDRDTFLLMILDMRRAQQRYFRSRSQECLVQARDLERQVDASLQAWINSQQLSLFTEDLP